MCLENAQSWDGPQEGTGWKAFAICAQITGGMTYGSLIYPGPYHPKGRWLRTGEPGFHVFEKQVDATRWGSCCNTYGAYAVKKVAWRRPLQRGTQMVAGGCDTSSIGCPSTGCYYDARAFTVREMMILEEEPCA